MPWAKRSARRINCSPALIVSAPTITLAGRPLLVSSSGWTKSAMPKSPWPEAMISRVLTPLPPWMSLQSTPLVLDEALTHGDEHFLVVRHRHRIDALGAQRGARRTWPRRER